MSDLLYDPDSLNLPAVITDGPPLSKHNGYYNSEKAAERYELEKPRRQALYAAEKILGKRDKSGRPKLKKLKQKHREMIAAFLDGYSFVEIADLFDVAVNTVQRVIGDPLAKEEMASFQDAYKQEFNQLLPQVTGSIRSGLRSGDIGTRLKAVDRFGKLHRVINGEQGEKTATERTQEIHAARFSFLKKVKDIAEKSGVIEAEAVIVETVESANLSLIHI